MKIIAVLVLMIFGAVIGFFAAVWIALLMQNNDKNTDYDED